MFENYIPYCILSVELTPLAHTHKSLLIKKRHMILNLKTDRKDLKTCPNYFSVEKKLDEFILVYSNCLFEKIKMCNIVIKY